MRVAIAIVHHRLFLDALFRFNDYSVVLQAAIEGQGVAMGWRHLVDPLIEQGLLVRPVPQSLTTDQPIYIVASRRGKLRAEAVYLQELELAAPDDIDPLDLIEIAREHEETRLRRGTRGKGRQIHYHDEELSRAGQG